MKTNTNAPVRRSLWNRILPVRVRHNLGLIVGSIVILVGSGLMLGSFQIRPIIFSKSIILPNISHNITNSIELFDLSKQHSISLEISDLSYQQMISDFEEFGEKTWIEADAVIDGSLIRSVGIRLKGNSTLMALSGEGGFGGFPGFGGPEGEGGPGGFPGFGGPGGEGGPGGFPGFGGPEGEGGPGGFPGFGGPGGEDGPGGFPGFDGIEVMLGAASADDPLSLPLLLSFDKFVAGRAYQGRTQLAIRPAADGASSLNEALALQLIKDSGQISQAYTWITLSINESETSTRLMIENPDQNYASALNSRAGVLYKSRSSNTFTYHGEDPTLYLEDFSQLNGIGSQDLSPVIKLLAWLDEVSEEDFDSELSQWLDINSFAKYVVTHDLMGNFDDMAGPGRNFLLRYDLADRRFTVITWDMNLAMSPMGDMFGGGPGGGFPDFGGEGFPGFGGDGFPGFPGGDGDNTDPEINDNTPADFPPAVPEAGGGGFPFAGGFPPPGGDGDFPFPEGFPGGGIQFGNSLKQKFMDSEVFSELITSTRAELLEFWFSSGYATELLNTLVLSVPVSDRLSEEQIATDVATLEDYISSAE